MTTTGLTKWAIDATHSKAGFKVKHLMISNVTGSFREFSGEAITVGDDFSTASVYFNLNTGSVDTEMADRDAHLKSPDFFDAVTYPEINFVGTGLKDLGDDIYELQGELSIKGVKKLVTLSAEFGGIMSDPWGNVKAGFSVNGKINRKDFGLNWNAALEAGGVLVGEEVKIVCDIQFAKLPA